ncbi:MAG: hypothetical protein ACI93P_000312 [bacterium]|jgi:hypothetical protein
MLLMVNILMTVQTALTSNINNDEYTIQGRFLPFDPSDVVSLNFKTDVTGEYSIALDHFEGLFAEGQDRISCRW